MKGNTWIISLLVLLNACTSSQAVLIDKVVETEPELIKLAELPTELKETSGLAITTSGTFLSHNDHGNAAKLYAFDKKGDLIQSLQVTNATNEDWEDLTVDEVGNLYIGDFGNNKNDRKDLGIYKIAKEQLSQHNNKILAEQITFTFEDQTAFPPIKTARFFDVEAMFYQENFIYLLTRDRSKPFNGNTRLYRLPNTVGHHQATFLATFKTDDKKNKGQITAADISQDGTTLAILANETVWIFSDYIKGKFFSGQVNRIDLSLDLQFESIAFQDDCTLYLTNEKKAEEAASLYELKVCALKPAIAKNRASKNRKGFYAKK